MKKYIIETKEVWCQNIYIEAKNKEEAIKKVQEGEGHADSSEFVLSHTLDADTWNVYKQ